ncbi:acyl carrier protein [Maritimibacter sp. 55A14]|uniref:acyl carrier protein n=1 Tax=Maritimibacter sp. 55A14 TaxID=2174844 RepID=UPI000D60505E|nr:acyl carrier protein [Maritimibacter sp. 55A14]PWE34028.1 acyl carrier protein [Maritimibacter sp. 55A14]
MTSDTSAIFDQISKILSAHAKTDTPITPETRIAADLAIDSVEMFDIVMEIEDAYDISFPIEEASDIDSVQSLVDTIGRLTDV